MVAAVVVGVIGRALTVNKFWFCAVVLILNWRRNQMLGICFQLWLFFIFFYPKWEKGMSWKHVGLKRLLILLAMFSLVSHSLNLKHNLTDEERKWWNQILSDHGWSFCFVQNCSMDKSFYLCVCVAGVQIQVIKKKKYPHHLISENNRDRLISQWV